jgi:hypothetical protein
MEYLCDDVVHFPKYFCPSYLTKPYPGPQSVLIMDNAHIHHSPEIDDIDGQSQGIHRVSNCEGFFLFHFSAAVQDGAHPWLLLFNLASLIHRRPCRMATTHRLSTWVFLFYLFYVFMAIQDRAHVLAPFIYPITLEPEHRFFQFLL